jgi:tRNA dimethylallyltransferase
MRKIIFIVGPTAVGKTSVALELAKKIPLEIISCDSMQVYKKMNIISSKPTTAQQQEVRHHLISFVAPSKEFSAAAYRREALKTIKHILRRKKIPVFVGGTGLYMSVLIDGIFLEKTEDRDLRQAFYRLAEKEGSEFLHRRLKSVDPESVSKIHPHDLRRIIRALEVYEKTGLPISVWHKRRKGIVSDYDVRIFALNRSREDLYARIDKRIDQMFKDGLIEEIKNLLRMPLSKTASCALGIAQIKGYLEGNYGPQEARQLLKYATHHYAKRQLTWFRKDKRITWIIIRQGQTPQDIVKKIIHQMD